MAGIGQGAIFDKLKFAIDSNSRLEALELLWAAERIESEHFLLFFDLQMPAFS
jgi:DNA-directed RNA polymerase alpha subunit